MQFQYWLAITFATIVACYIAGPFLDFKLKVGIAILYISSALLFAMIYVTYVMRYTELLQFLQSMQADYPMPFKGFIGPLRIIIWIFGSGLTLWFMFHNRHEDESLHIESS